MGKCFIVAYVIKQKFDSLRGFYGHEQLV